MGMLVGVKGFRGKKKKRIFKNFFKIIKDNFILFCVLILNLFIV